MSWPQKHMYICQLVELNDPKQRRAGKPVSRRRMNSNKFFMITEQDKRIQVCRKMFLNTFGLKEKMVRSWAKNRKKKFGLYENPSVIQNRKKVAREQSETNQALLERKIRYWPFWSIIRRWNLIFVERIQTKSTLKLNIKLLSIYTSSTLKFAKMRTHFSYHSQFSAAHWRISTSVCLCPAKISATLVRLTKWATWILTNSKCIERRWIELARKKKLKASALYYRSNLQLHNFIIYDIFTHDSSNYVWDETESDLQSSTFTSIIIHHLEKKIKTSSLPMTIYSDGCGYQNRNVLISNALRLLAIKHSRNITQKFLEVRHTHMKCNSTHACIERKTRDMTFDLPSDFETAIKAARDKPFPFEVEHLTHAFFRNYDDQDYLTLKSIRPGIFLLSVYWHSIHFINLFSFTQDIKLVTRKSTTFDACSTLQMVKFYINWISMTTSKCCHKK